jgi:hypothetical protein
MFTFYFEKKVCIAQSLIILCIEHTIMKYIYRIKQEKGASLNVIVSEKWCMNEIFFNFRLIINF